MFEEGELVGDLGGGQDSAGDGWVGIRRRQVGEAVRRSHSRLVDTVADARAVPARDDEREIGVARVVVERPATAGRVRAILQQVQNDAYWTIYPFELAAKDAVYPIPALRGR